MKVSTVTGAPQRCVFLLLWSLSVWVSLSKRWCKTTLCFDMRSHVFYSRGTIVIYLLCPFPNQVCDLLPLWHMHQNRCNNNSHCCCKPITLLGDEQAVLLHREVKDPCLWSAKNFHNALGSWIKPKLFIHLLLVPEQILYFCKNLGWILLMLCLKSAKCK